MGGDVYSSVSGNADKSLVEELHGATMYCAAVNNSCQGIGVVCRDVVCCILFCFALWLETRSHSIALDTLQLALWTRLA